MKLFFYKSVLIVFLFLLTFHFSIGYLIKKIKTEIEMVVSKEKAEDLKIKIKEEMQNAIDKENFIKKDDAVLINKFIEKIKKDLEKNK